MRKWQKVLMIFTVILLVLVVGALFVWSYLFGGLKHVELNDAELGIVENYYGNRTDAGDNPGQADVKKETPIKNIAIFGLSVSDSGGIDTDRSDMNLIVSVDPDYNRVCITSVLRDSKVPIEGHDPQKINAAYKYGGPTLAIKTLNQNFHLNISEYVTVNFENLIEIVDSVGGVYIELTPEETTKVYGTQAGLNLLNGEQALEYASIRKIDSDYYRASRQQNIMMAILAKIKSMPKTSYPMIIHDMCEYLETSLDFDEIWAIVNSLDIANLKVVTNTIPDINFETDLWGGMDETGSWVYVYDIENAAARLHRIIYDRSENGAK